MNRFTTTDATEILRLAKMVQVNQQDQESIFFLYREYIDGNLNRYTTGCGCHTDISKLYQKVIDFYSVNGDKFIN